MSGSMLTYRMDGPMLILTKSGSSTPQERAALYDALRADPSVPTGALLLLDLRLDADMLRGDSEFGSRLLVLRHALGLKLGPACAMIVHARYHADVRALQGMPVADGFRFGM